MHEAVTEAQPGIRGGDLIRAVDVRVDLPAGAVVAARADGMNPAAGKHRGDKHQTPHRSTVHQWRDDSSEPRTPQM